MTKPIVRERIELLLDVLDKDCRHIERLLARLDGLRAALIRRDDSEMSEVLGAIRREAAGHTATERQRQDLRQQLADDLGWSKSDVTLSGLKAVLSGAQHRALAERQAGLRSLVETLKREYALTAMLVSDCARLNRSLTQALFGGEGGTGVTYNASGSTRHQGERTLVSLQL
jgi:hypothetical protein